MLVDSVDQQPQQPHKADTQFSQELRQGTLLLLLLLLYVPQLCIPACSTCQQVS
jgi:hypothetical protein